MKLTFLGAAHEVTGSCYLLEACGKRLLVDCGMEQGRDTFVNQEIPAAASEIDGVLLTHAHLDHSGRLPLLYKQGFRGTVYTTEATCELCGIMLRDSAHIQESEAEWRNRKAQRSGAAPYEPLYTMEDTEGLLSLIHACGYGECLQIAEGLRVRFCDIGHLLGSACIEVWVREGEIEKKLVFSGDIGNINQPILRDPATLSEADYVVIESTYGARSHGERPDYLRSLAQIIQTTFDRGGNVVIPAFAVGRTQEMLYFLRQIKEEGRVKGHDRFKVVVDSPLAVEATHIFRENDTDYFDEEARALVLRGVNPLDFEGLSLAVSTEESKAINEDRDCKVIISASGMCDAGRIRHHLKHNLWRAESTILFVGYQAEGTIGRRLIEGAESVKLFGEKIEVRAQIETLAGVSGHADREGLMRWAAAFGNSPARFFVTHGDEENCEALRAQIERELGIASCAPYSGECWDLAQDRCLVQGSRERVAGAKEGKKDFAPSTGFARLLAAYKALGELVQRSRNSANKELARFADAIEALIARFSDKE